MKMSRFVLLALAAMLVGAGVGQAAFYFPPAPPYQPLSTNHVSYGFSQFVASSGMPDESWLKNLRISNPGRDAMVAAILVYEGGTADFDSGDGTPTGTGGDPGRYAGCTWVMLPPHGSIKLEDDFLNANSGDPDRPMVQILAVPVTPVRAGFFPTRKADGLGVIAQARGEKNRGFFDLAPVHPSVFTLPADPAEQAAAAACMCGIAAAAGDFTLWLEFGVFCP